MYPKRKDPADPFPALQELPAQIRRVLLPQKDPESLHASNDQDLPAGEHIQSPETEKQ